MTQPNGRIDATPSSEAPRNERVLGLDEADSTVKVSPEDGHWRVYTQKGKPIGTFPTKAEAMTSAREHALKAEVGISVRRADGTFQETFTPRASPAK